MSFSSEVKKELLAVNSRARHCQLAELAGMLSGAGKIQKDMQGNAQEDVQKGIHIEGGRMHILFATENKQAADKYVQLLAQAADISVTLTQAYNVQQKNKTSYLADISEEEAVRHLLLLLKIMDKNGSLRQHMTLADGLLLQKSCCRRAFLRGAFLAAGSISDPKKSYHFEIVSEDRRKAEQIQEQFRSFELDAKIISRKNHEIVYLKEGSQIVDALNVMGAHAALLQLENVRILKEMRNDINRQVNCETANINKTVNAAYHKQEAIRFLQQKGVLQGLSQQLQEIAALRMEYPEATIQELGRLCSPPVGKSGVNHRLRRLEEIAEQAGFEKKE